MELIKQIKDTENQAKEIVEKAKQDAASLSEEAGKKRTERFKTAQQRRIKAIDEAISKAEQDGTVQVEQITDAGNEAISSLKSSCSEKSNTCVKKVLSQLQQA
ncbi:MAG: hypothetical protein B6I25_02960 [Planctomycetales bacterium 4572_13]|nr:MAG: hypothetical protein B6I25_02960 [Planctomycetales bacterium 4572_13]